MPVFFSICSVGYHLCSRVQLRCRYFRQLSRQTVSDKKQHARASKFRKWEGCNSRHLSVIPRHSRDYRCSRPNKVQLLLQNRTYAMRAAMDRALTVLTSRLPDSTRCEYFPVTVSICYLICAAYLLHLDYGTCISWAVS